MEYKQIAAILGKSRSGVNGKVQELKLPNKCIKVKIGEKQGKLTVISFIEKKNRRRRVRLQCECGNTRDVSTDFFRAGMTCCGCQVRPNNEKEPGVSAWNNVFINYKDSAKDRAKEFSLTSDNVKQICSKNCYYCDLEPQDFNPYLKRDGTKVSLVVPDRTIFRAGIKRNGIDRVDNNKGYIIENCVPCCKICNFMKHTLGEKEFLAQVERIFKFKIGKR